VKEEWLSERADISARIGMRRGARQRTSNDGSIWIDHHCMFHQDTHRSATWNEATGTYYCRTEDRTYLPPQVLNQLDMATTRGRRALVNPRRDERPLPNLVPDHIYTYLWPDGRPSHMKWRWDSPKRFSQVGLDGTPGLPAEHWPIYGDHGLPEGIHVIVVEGEKAVDRILQLDDALDQVLIRGITCGSVADLGNHKAQLGARLGELRPRSVTLWPDNDEAGLAAMRGVHLELSKQGITHAQIQPATLGLPLKADVVDYADRGDSLATLIARQTGTLESEPVQKLFEQTRVTGDGHVVHASRSLIPINEDSARVIWWRAYSSLPTQRQLHEYLARVRDKSYESPLVVRPRAYTNERVTWWRPSDQGQCLRIDAHGIDPHADDPEGIFLVAPDDGRHVDTSVDLNGEYRDLLELLSIWELDDTAIAMIVGWLVCAMGGLQTPIMFIKSSAGTGKTTLARFLLSVVEPMCPELEPNVVQDSRAFQDQLVKYPVAMIDNASRVESRVEDLLSRLVTGCTVSVRPLYENHTVSTFLRRAIIVTTTNWDVYKGDLASRMIVVQPKRKTEAYFSDRTVQRRYGPLIPKIRGYVMKLLSTYFAGREQIDETRLRMRIGDLGVVFETLGYDSTALEAKEATARSEIISSNDPWLDAIVDMWTEEASIYVFKTTKEVIDTLNAYGCQNVPVEKSPRLARWMEEKAPFFRDHGFQVERVMNNPRGYRFKRVENPDS
jgi:hypothetical protein